MCGTKRSVCCQLALTGIYIFLAVRSPALADSPTEMGEDGRVHVSASQIVRSATERASASIGPNRHVAIVASASGDISDPFFTDSRDRLIASGEFATVTVIDAGQVTPSVLELAAFDAVLIWSNFSFADAATLGDRLAEYVDQGGGVVVAVFANTTQTPGRYIAGKWLTHGYEVVPPQGGATSGIATLGTIHVPAHPLISGVTSFSGGLVSFRPTTKDIAPTATLIAEWSDGATLVAVREDTIGSRVDLGFYPPSDAIVGFPDFWDSSTDGDIILVNALRYAADRPPLIPGDSDGDGDVDRDDADRFETCLRDPGNSIVTAGCLTFDFNSDQIVDCADWADFLLAYTEPGLPPLSEACSIPTVSHWGLITLSLTLLVAGTLLAKQAREY
jgi:hypothetical protein